MRKPATPKEELELLDQQPGYSDPNYISDEGVMVEKIPDHFSQYVWKHQEEHVRLNRSLRVLRWAYILLIAYLILTQIILL
jgi:hypothetical protein